MVPRPRPQISGAIPPILHPLAARPMLPTPSSPALAPVTSFQGDPMSYFDLADKPIIQWNARAIFHPNSEHPIDLLPDRQSVTDNGTDDQKHNLINWVNLRALPAL